MKNTNNNVTVSIICTAFNQENYIEQTLIGFLSQRTSFKYEVLIHDDASTDNTADIIRRYAAAFPDLIFPIYESKNQLSQGISVTYNYGAKRAKGKYIALCEGDDFWIDPYKLEKEVACIRKTNASLVHTKAFFYNQKLEKYEKQTHGLPGQLNEMLNNGNTVCTLTSLFPKDLYLDYFERYQSKHKEWKMGDYPLWLFLASKGRVEFIPECTSVYRILSHSASHNPDFDKSLQFRKSMFSIRKLFSDISGIAIEPWDEAFENYYCAYNCLTEKYTKETKRRLSDSYNNLLNKTPDMKIRSLFCSNPLMLKFYLWIRNISRYSKNPDFEQCSKQTHDFFLSLPNNLKDLEKWLSTHRC